MEADDVLNSSRESPCRKNIHIIPGRTTTVRRCRGGMCRRLSQNEQATSDVSSLRSDSQMRRARENENKP